MDEFARRFAEEASGFFARAGVGGVILIGFWLAGAVVQRVTQRVYDLSEASIQDAVGLIGQTIKIALIVTGVITALGTVGVNVTALVAGLGLTGFALGFAFRDVLSNLVAGLILLIHRPFRRNDHIAVTGYQGVVTSVDLRYTTLQSEQGRVLIPNSVLFTNPISLRGP